MVRPSNHTRFSGFYAKRKDFVNTLQLDPANVPITLASVIFGPPLAAIIGHHAVILISPTVGAAWALWRRDPCSLWAALSRPSQPATQPAQAGFFTPGRGD